MSAEHIYSAGYYADGTIVRAGDRIRYKQAPGGMLPPSGDWTYGTAEWTVARPDHHATTLDLGMDPYWMVLTAENGRKYNLPGHIIERIAA